MEQNEQPKRKKRIWLIILLVLLALILSAVIGVIAYVEKTLNLMNRNPDDSTISPSEYEEFMKEENQDNNFTGETINPEDVDWNVSTEPVVDQSHIINLMLIGQDRRPGERRARSDVMLLCTINTETKELTLTSFMRDLYVPIPGYQDNRMNACYAFAGMKLLNKCMESNFGVLVDGNIEVDFDGFKNVIDVMGGVDIELSNSEANHLIAKGHSAVAGMNHLDGAAALTYARNRSVGNSDFSRTARQRKVITALVNKSRSLNLSQANALVQQILPLITTDMTNREILDYTIKLLPLLKDLKINTQQIPAAGTFKYASVRGMSVLVPDLAANRAIMEGIMDKG